MPNDPLMHAGHYLQSLLAYWWPFCRIMAVFSLAPMFSHKAISVRVRILLALALTLVLGAALPTPPTLDPLSLAGMLATIEQIAMGLLLGLALLLVFTVFTLIGDVVSTQLGLSMAVFNDPMNGVSSASIIYQLYFILLALLFFAIDGHLVTVSIIYQSFVSWPIGSGLFYDGLQTIAWSMAWVISAALLIALPIVFCMTLVQFCFGLLNRISPAMNLFSLGFLPDPAEPGRGLPAPDPRPLGQDRRSAQERRPCLSRTAVRKRPKRPPSRNSRRAATMARSPAPRMSPPPFRCSPRCCCSSSVRGCFSMACSRASATRTSTSSRARSVSMTCR